jgi:2',3'-cyclic-nucleotide 2'-phosphodiesterase/3'-nucleotidase
VASRVGVVGATTPGVMVWDRDNVRGRLEVRDILPSVAEAVRQVREAGADVVVVTLHSGLDGPSSYDTVGTGLPGENVAARLAREVSGIDLVVVGHSHREIADTTIGGTMLVQAKNWATSVAVAELSLTREDGRWRVARRRGSLVQAAGHAESEAVVRATEAAHAATVRYVTSVVGARRWPGAATRPASPTVRSPTSSSRCSGGPRAPTLASTAAFSLARGSTRGR